MEEKKRVWRGGVIGRKRGVQCFGEVPHFPAPSVPGFASWKPCLCQTPPTRSEQPDANQQGPRHLFQTTAQCDPLHPSNHATFDEAVALMLVRFSFFLRQKKKKFRPELTCASEDWRQRTNRVERREAWRGPDPSWRQEKSRDGETEGRKRRTNKATLLHFNQPLPSHMAAEHPEGSAVMNPNCSLFTTSRGVSMQICPERYLLYARPNVWSEMWAEKSRSDKSLGGEMSVL